MATIHSAMTARTTKVTMKTIRENSPLSPDGRANGYHLAADTQAP